MSLKKIFVIIFALCIASILNSCALLFPYTADIIVQNTLTNVGILSDRSEADESYLFASLGINMDVYLEGNEGIQTESAHIVPSSYLRDTELIDTYEYAVFTISWYGSPNTSIQVKGTRSFSIYAADKNEIYSYKDTDAKLLGIFSEISNNMAYLVTIYFAPIPNAELFNLSDDSNKNTSVINMIFEVATKISSL